MNRKLITLLIVIGVLLLSSAATAHNITLWAYVEGGKVFVEAFTSDGKKIADAKVVVINAKGEKLLEGVTDAEGKYNFTPAKAEDMTIVLMLDEAHKSEFKISMSDFEPATPTPTPKEEGK